MAPLRRVSPPGTAVRLERPKDASAAASAIGSSAAPESDSQREVLAWRERPRGHDPIAPKRHCEDAVAARRRRRYGSVRLSALSPELWSG